MCKALSGTLRCCLDVKSVVVIGTGPLMPCVPSQVLQQLLNHFRKRRDKVLLFSFSTKVSRLVDLGSPGTKHKEVADYCYVLFIPTANCGEGSNSDLPSTLSYVWKLDRECHHPVTLKVKLYFLLVFFQIFRIF